MRSALARFRPWSTPDGACPQGSFLRAAATHRTRIYRAGNRCGKTFVLGVDAALRLQGWHPFARQRGPVHGWLVGVDWEQGVGGLLWPAVKPWLEADQIKGITYARRSDPEIPIAVSFTNGSLLEFKSSDSDLKKFAGAKLHFAGMDEEMERSYVNEVRARLVDLGGDLSLTLTPIARKIWVRELEREPGTCLVRASMRQAAAAGMLDSDATAEFLATLGDREKAVRELGDFAALEGLVYPEFNREIHVLRPRGSQLVDGTGKVVGPWPLPPSWSRVSSMDFGYANPACNLVAVRSPNGTLVVDTCRYAAGVKIDTWGRILKEALPPFREWDGDETRLARPVACDHDAGERAMLEAAGVPTAAAKKEIEKGLATVTRRLVARKLYFVVHEKNAPTHPIVGRSDAHQLVWELEGYRFPEQPSDRPSVKDQPVKKDDHACDALRYLVMAEDVSFDLPPMEPPKKRAEALAGLVSRRPPPMT